MKPELTPALPNTRRWELHPAHTSDLLGLQRALEAAQGKGFRLLFAEWNQIPERDGLIRHLAENHPGSTLLTLTQNWPSDYSALLEQLESLGRDHSLVQVVGFENWRSSRPEAFKRLNHRREEIAARCPVSLLWWLIPDDLQAIALQAPDFWAWRTGVLDFTHAAELPPIAKEWLDLFQGPTQMQREARLSEIESYLSTEKDLSARAAGELHREVGDILESLGRWEDATQHLLAAEQHSREANDLHSAVHALRLLADIDMKRGQVDAALERLEIQVLPIFTKLRDDRSRAITLGQIARIRADKGEVDAALALHQERLDVYEGLGDKRERAVTLGDIARIRAAKGEVDAALALHQERLGIFEGLGDKDGEANALWSIAKIELEKQTWQAAFEHLEASYAINLQLGRLDGICIVGLDLGQFLCATGQREEGLAKLQRSLVGFQKLGWAQQIAQTEAMLEKWA
jgi:tetratricopeptide (TPR) repeat protein